MIALTLVAVVVTVLHPIAWSRRRDAVRGRGARRALGIVVFLAAIALGIGSTRRSAVGSAVGHARSRSRCSSSWRSRRRRALLGSPALRASGRWPRRLPRTTRRPLDRRPPRRPKAGCGRARALGMPIALGGRLPGSSSRSPSTSCRYVPWVALGNQDRRRLAAGQHRPDAGRPDRVDVPTTTTTCAPTHAASSPWWAWPLDLKPVWFYQDSFAAGTAGVDLRRRQPGHLLARRSRRWRSSAWQAWRRRSLALALVVDRVRRASGCRGRASTARRSSTTTTRALPFLVIALAYFLAELWHGAVGADVDARSRRRRAGGPGPGRCCGCSRARCARSSGSRR